MKLFYFAAIGLLAASLAACGGGGGGSSPGGSVVPTGPATTAPPNPTPSPSPSTGTASISGTVVDYNSSAPIAGATVIVGSTLVLGATPPPSTPAGDFLTTTNASGVFGVNQALNGAGYVMIFPTDGHASLHSPATYAAGHAFGTLKLSTPTADDLSFLAAINSDRATYSAQPVIIDELLLEAARLWTAYEGLNGRNVDSDPLAPAPYTTSITVYASLVGAINNGSLGTFNVSMAQNRAGGANGAAAEAAFRTEGPTGPHFSTIIAPATKWIGIGPSDGYVLDVFPPPAGV